MAQLKDTIVDGNLTVEGEILKAKLSTNILDQIYPIGSVFESTSNINPNDYLNGTWVLKEEGSKKIYIGSQVLFDSKEGSYTTDSGGYISLIGAYGTSLIDGLFNGIVIPNEYHKEYRLTFQGSTSHSNAIYMALNNIETSATATWSGNSFRVIGASPYFKESDIVLEPTHNYTSSGINLKYYVSAPTSGVSADFRIYSPTIHGYLVSDSVYYTYERKS